MFETQKHYYVMYIRIGMEFLELKEPKYFHYIYLLL